MVYMPAESSVQIQAPASRSLRSDTSDTLLAVLYSLSVYVFKAILAAQRGFRLEIGCSEIWVKV